MSTSRRPSGAVITAMAGAAAVSAQFIGGKAARDALYLNYLPVTTLPTMIVATAVASIIAVVLTARVFVRAQPSRFVSLLFLGSAALLIVEWLLLSTSPKVVTIALYLHISGFGPLLGSGFWLIATECFDPRTAKQRFGQIAGAGTIGGLVGGIIAWAAAELFSVAAMLPVMAAISVYCAWQIQQMAGPVASLSPHAIDMSPELIPAAPRSGMRVLSEAPYLRDLAALVLLGTIGAGLIDYVFKVQASTMGTGEALGRFFGIYYAATSLVMFLIQTMSSRHALERLGLAAATGSPSLALLASGVGGLLIPALRAPLVMIGRGGESVLRGSLFRSGYELFYTPLTLEEKQAAKSIIDVGFDRLGELTGAAAIWLTLMFAPEPHDNILLVLTVASAGAALYFAGRLNRGYILALERSLLNRATDLEFSDIQDLTTRTVMFKTLTQIRSEHESADRQPTATTTTTSLTSVTSAAVPVDPDVKKIAALRSHSKRAVTEVLRGEEELSAALVPHAIQLLAWDPVAEDAVFALRRVAEYRIGELTDALLDPSQPFAVRRRLPRVFSVCVSQRAADGLIAALEDQRFEVRFQCARSLAAILDKNPRIRIDSAFIYGVVQKEVEVGRPLWESHRLLDPVNDEEGGNRNLLDDVLKGRANQSLTHVFTLLSLVLPTEPLRIAFRGLHTNDASLRGTSLEYLEGVLPPAIHQRLWPFLENRPLTPAPRTNAEVLAELLKSNQSITWNLEELKKRAQADKDNAAANRSKEQAKI